MVTLCIAESCNLVISIAPKSDELSSPRRHWERFAISIFPSFMILSIFIELLGEPITRRIRGEETNWPTLFKIGEITSCCWSGRHWSYSSIQKCFKTWSSILDTVLFLKDLFVRIVITSFNVEPGTSVNVNRVFRRIYSSLGPQEWPKILKKIETIPDTTN